jgi:hypothetical protein
VKLVRVDWMDAFGGVREGWRGIEDIKGRATAPAISIGFLARETDEKVVILPHLISADVNPVDFTTCSGDGELVIPKTWIRSIVELRPIKPRRKKPETPTP